MTALRLRPAWSDSALNGRGRSGGSSGAGLGGHRTRFLGVVVNFGQDGAVIVFAFRKQRGDFAQLLGGLLKGLDLLGELSMLRLLTAQDFMDILHRSPCFEIYGEGPRRSTPIPIEAITRVTGRDSNHHGKSSELIQGKGRGLRGVGRREMVTGESGNEGKGKGLARSEAWDERSEAS